MGRYVTVSAKVPKELKKRLRELNINISQLVRSAIEEEVRRREEQALRELAGEVSQLLRKIPPTEITKVIRETREER
jgi:post-segregation antitoxin (ccd killing protein)